MFKEDLQPTRFGKWFLGITIPILLILSMMSKDYPLSYFLMIIVIPIEWLFRWKIKAVVKLLRIKGNLMGLLVVGWCSVIINQEIMAWVGGWRNLPNISLIGDFVLMTPIVLIGFSIWGLLVKKYYYSIGEIFTLMGILGISVEVVGKTIPYNWPLWLSFLLSFFFFICYAWTITFSFWLIDFRRGKNRNRMRYILAILIPWLGLFICSITSRGLLMPWLLENMTGGII